MSKNSSHESGADSSSRGTSTDAWNQMMARTWASALAATDFKDGNAAEEVTLSVTTATEHISPTQSEPVALDRRTVFNQALGELLTEQHLPEGAGRLRNCGHELTRLLTSGCHNLSLKLQLSSLF